MEHVKPIRPLRLDGNIVENWRKWKQRWVLYAKASGVDSKDEETQCTVFLHTMGEEVLEVYDTFTFTEEEANKIEPLVARFEAYCSPKKNITYERYLFFSCTQNSRTIDTFVTDLRMKTCEFGTLHDSLIKDRIVCGIDNNSVRERLLRNTELTLQVAINTVRAAETSKTQIETLTNSALEAATINLGRKQNQKTKPPLRHQPPKLTKQKQSKKPCARCGSHHKPRECRAFGTTCHRCQGKNHFAHMCFTKSPNSDHQKLHEVEQQSDTETDEDLFLGELESSRKDKNELFTNLNVNAENICFKIDTGAQCNVIPEHAFEKLRKKPSLQTTKVTLTTYGGVRLPIKGPCTMKIKHNDQNIDVKFFVVAIDKAQPLIGLQTC